VSQLVYDTLRKKGPYKEAAEMYSNLRADLNMLEASRAQWPETAYRDKLNEIVSQQQTMKQIQARELQNLEQQLIDTIGPVFEAQYGKPFSYSVLSDLVRQNVRQ
jgi:protoheme ferro-lyase